MALPLSPVSAQDAALVEAAKKEGTVSVYTSTDAAQSQKLQDAFTAKYGIKIAYNDLGTNGAYNQVISEAAASQVTADVVWSSAMDLQMTLVKDGYAQEYASPEAANIPAWANYKNILYGTTVEPIGMIYNTKALTERSRPENLRRPDHVPEGQQGRAAGQGCDLRSGKERLRLPPSLQRCA